MKTNIALLIFLAFATFTSCKKESTSDGTLNGYSANGIFVVNEGSFNNGNASISYISPDNAVLNDIFDVVNGKNLGDVAQSFTIHNDKAYIVVNNSQKIEICTLNDFKSAGTITGINSPRYFLGLSSTKGYVTDWNDNAVKVVNLTTNQVVGSIPCGKGPEQMVLGDGKVFVCNIGGFGNDSTVTVIDPSTDKAVATIQVGLNPNSMRMDTNNNLWVLCGGFVGDDYVGGTGDDIGGSLYCINTDDYSVVHYFSMTQDHHPLKLNINGTANKLYFLNGTAGYTGRVFELGINDTMIPNSALIEKSFYGLGVHPSDNSLYAGTANFSTKGWVFHYDNAGNLLDSNKVGIAPSSFTFNP